jgi:hypothetical protein
VTIVCGCAPFPPDILKIAFSYFFFKSFFEKKRSSGAMQRRCLAAPKLRGSTVINGFMFVLLIHQNIVINLALASVAFPDLRPVSHHVFILPFLWTCNNSKNV